MWWWRWFVGVNSGWSVGSDFNDVIFVIWLTSFGSFWLALVLLTFMAAATTFVTILLFSVLGFVSVTLEVVAFFLSLLFSFVILGVHGISVPLFSPLVLGLQLLGVVVDEEEVKVAVLVVSQLVGLGLDPGSASQLIVVQELVAEDVLIIDVCHNELSPGLTSIGEWVWTWCKSICVKQLQDDLLTLAMGTLSGLDTDKNRLIVISDVDEGLGCFIPEEEAVFSSFVSLDPEPARLELKFGVFVEDSGVTKIRSSSLSLLCDVESLVRHQEIIL